MIKCTEVQFTIMTTYYFSEKEIIYLSKITYIVHQEITDTVF